MTKPKAWINVSLTEYPAADGTPKHPKPGDLILAADAAKGWPPEWVVSAGHVRPATPEEE